VLDDGGRTPRLDEFFEQAVPGAEYAIRRSIVAVEVNQSLRWLSREAAV